MARGTIYHITTNEYSLGDMIEDDFAEHLESLCCDYVQTRLPSTESSKRELDRLRTALAEAGFPIEQDDLPEECAFAFRTGSEAELKAAQIAYFKPALDALKTAVSAITPEEFACDTAAAYKVQELAADPYGDAVYLDLGTGPSTYGLMSAIRNLLPERTYYVDETTVYMH